MAERRLVTRVTTSPPPNCAICLGTCTNRCYSDSCMHEFCFSCLLEWSKIKPECPLCKQTFRSIIHNIKSVDEYDEHIVENIRVEEIDPTFVYLPPVTTPPPHQYHFRTTLTVDTRGEHAIQQMLLSHPLITIGTFPPERYPHHRRRRNGDTSTAFRRSIYAQNLWVISPPDITGRYRDVTPSHYRRDPAARARLVPWLNRELNALLYDNTQHVMHLVDIIMDHLLRHHICSRVFRTLLCDYLGNKTDHFIHEFYSFMRSPFDMIGYDRHAIYTERPTPLLTSSVDLSDDYDSDVIIVNSTTTTNNNNNNNNNNQTQQTPIIIDLIDTDSDEPIIVSEETPTPVNNNNNNNNSNNNDNSINDNSIIVNNGACHSGNRKPILPLKIRIKSKRKSKEKKPRHHSKRRRKHIRSSSSSSASSSSSSSTSPSSTTSSSTLSSSSSSTMATTTTNSSSVYEYKKRTRSKNKCNRNLKLSKRSEKKYKKKFKIINNDNSNNSSSSSSGEDDDEDNIPLAKMIRKHKTKCKSRKLPKEHQQYFDYDQNIMDRLNYSLPSNEISQASPHPLSRHSSQDCLNSTKSISIDDGHHKGFVNNSTYDNDDYYDIKPNVKSEIKIIYHKDDDNTNNDNNASGPSTSGNRIRDFIDENNRLWYYRPHSYDQDSSSDN